MGPFVERDWTRPPPTAAQLRHDVVVGVVGAVVCVASVELYRSAYGAPAGGAGAEAYLLFALAGLLLAGRRRLPLTTLVLEAVLFVVIGERLGMLGYTFTVQMILFAVLYAAWAWSARPRSLYAVSTLVVVGMVTWLLHALLTDPTPAVPSQGLVPSRAASILYALTINAIYLLGAIAWGQSAWRSTRRRLALARQHERDRDEQEERRERAVRDERVRIARDLHDVVAHHVSGIGLQAAGAGRVLATDPATARVALGTIESSSREAVAQMHQLVGLLRERGEPTDDHETRAPRPGVADIAALAGGERPVVEHRTVGEPFGVPATTGHSLFRIAQEAVTNARRHSGARHATLVVRYLDAGVEVELTDDGRGTPRPAPPGGGGYGLTGIRERAALHGGSVEIGPRPQGGFRVRVRVPVPVPAGTVPA